MDIVFVIVTILLLAVAIPSVCIGGFLRVRRKGYRSPGATLVLLIAATIGIACAVAISPKIPQNARVVTFMSAFFWLPLLVFTFLILAALWLLPRRNPRRFGTRRPRFPFAATGKLVIGVGVGISLLLVLSWARGTVNESTLSKTFQMLLIFIVVGAYFLYVGRRAKAPESLEEVSKRDQRAPVLYLRPFNQEAEAFVVGLKSQYGQYATGFQRFLITLGRYEERMNSDPNVAIRFEEYLSGELTTEIGPFFALGNPEDYTSPEGAVRTYANDTDWKEYLERLAASASCIVTEVGGSENLSWEFGHLRERGWQEKLFVITRPEGKKAKWFDRTYLLLKGVKPTTWSDFRRTLTTLGYDLPENVANGSVLTFDAAGKCIPLTTGAHDPGQFVEPIRGYLISKAGYTEESFAAPLPAVEIATPEKRILRILLSDKVFFVLVGLGLVLPFVRAYIPGLRYLGNSGVFRKGIELYNQKHYEEALPYFQRAAEGGNTQAMTNLGLMYEQGQGVSKNEAKAVELYNQAINDEDNPESQAMVNLGAMYLNGEGGLSKDECKALEFFKKAVDAGNENGMLVLGAMYEDGACKLPKDMALALNWYKKSADKGNEVAKQRMQELQSGTSSQSQ